MTLQLRKTINLFIYLCCMLVFSLPAQESEEEAVTKKIDSDKDVFAIPKERILQYKFKNGDILEVRKFSEQKIMLNDEPLDRFVHNRIFLENAGQNKQKGYYLKGSFVSQFRYDKSDNSPFEEEEVYQSAFFIEPKGAFNVPSFQFMPNQRGIPTFPDEVDPGFSGHKKMKRGYSWTEKGSEVMKFDTMIEIPIEVKYEYRGDSIVDTPEGEKKVHKIMINYEINKELSYSGKDNVPVKVFGFATGVLLWDEKEFIPYYIQDEYSLIIVYKNEKTTEFKIKSKSFYKKIKPVSETLRTELSKNLEKEFSKEDKKNRPSVEKKNSELVIQLPDILFEFDSSELTSESKKILENIAEILQKQKGINLHIRGYTDNIGTKNYNENLSRERSQRVAAFLMKKMEIPSENVTFRGFGSENPIASNSTADGRKKNRRVEIVIPDR